MIYGTPQNGIEIKQLLLMVTRTYNDIYRRDYNINITGSMLNQLSELSHPIAQPEGVALNEQDLVNKLPNIIGYSGNILDKSFIPNGWSTERMRFIMEVDAFSNGITMCYFIQGFSEYHDPTLSGNIDDNMRFFINSVTQVRKVHDFTNGINRIMPYETYQVLRDISPDSQYGIMDDNKRIIMPQNALVNLDIQESWRTSGSNVMNVTDLLSPDVVKTSRRKNNNPMSYLVKTMNAYRDVVKSNPDEIYVANAFQSAANSIAEPDITANMFVAALANVTNRFTPTDFSLNELLLLDPDIQYKIKKFERVDHLDTVPNLSLDSNVTESNLNPTPENLKATYLANTIPSLMLDCLLFSANISITNTSIEPVIIVTSANTIIQDLDLIQAVQLFETKLKSIVYPKITDNSLTMIDLHMTCEVIGDISVSISINGYPPILFRYPTFADSMYTPMVTNLQKRDLLYEDIGSVIDAAYGIKENPNDLQFSNQQPYDDFSYNQI